ncbi:MAG: Flp pilus assembly complex ATPase component TadA [Burkholderiaceae bacterium]|nr:Flp pilus assembly complex ATPase component TadA [Burkholderiaceae bacterium]
MSEREMPQRLGELLVSTAQIGSSELAQALDFQRAHGGRLGAILVRMGALSEESLYQGLARQLGLSLIGPAEIHEAEVQAGLAAWGFSRDWWVRQQALPWVDADGLRHVGGSDPQQLDLRETLEAQGGETALQWHFMLPATLERWHQGLSAPGQGGVDMDARTLRELAEDAPVISFVNNVLAQAVEARASDIHLEPGEREFDVRFRIDGVLHTRMSMPMSRYPAIASRVKLVSQLDIAERRLPQDGRTSIRVAGEEMDVRVSAIPAVHGESLVMRLLPKQRADLKLERLGMEADQLAMFRQWLQLPNGLVLVTGPTGSGKSTTLYGALAAVNDFSRKIITVEDPVEFRLPHVVQIQTQTEIGYTFARALRSILRHDPDIIMVGEIRDRETAEIAVQSALTGHLVLATLHTNDALSAVTRLVDMGVEPYLVAAALKAMMAQRLVRRLCPECSVPAPDTALDERWGQLLPRLQHSDLQGKPANWRRAVGCAHCQQTGFRGRIGIYELVTVGAEMQHRIAAAAPQSEVQALADAAGRRSLVEDGLIKVRAGLTTFDEVLRASGGLALE